MTHYSWINSDITLYSDFVAHGNVFLANLTRRHCRIGKITWKEVKAK